MAVAFVKLPLRFCGGALGAEMKVVRSARINILFMPKLIIKNCAFNLSIFASFARYTCKLCTNKLAALQS